HQALMNIAYDFWRETDTFANFDLLEEKYGAITKFAVMTGNFNYQVCNGGIIQYYDNGYGDEGRSGCFSKHDPEMPRFLEFKSLVEQLNLHHTVSGAKVYKILNKIFISLDDDRYIEEDQDCCTCNGSGFNEETSRPCEECGGKGWIRESTDNPDYGCVANTDYLNTLDSEYYKVNEEWMVMLNRFFSLWIEYNILP